MQVLSLIEASEAVLEEKQWQQFAASGSCTLSTNEKPRSIVPECSRPITMVPKPGGVGGGRGDRNPCFQTEPSKQIMHKRKKKQFLFFKELKKQTETPFTIAHFSIRKEPSYSTFSKLPIYPKGRVQNKY